MVYVNNKKLLRQVNPILNGLLTDLNNQETSYKVIIENSRKNSPTIKIENEKKEYIYMHSKYDPIREAKEFVNNIEISEDTKHILFIGTGLGYHISEILGKNIDFDFSIFEPNINVLNAFLSKVDITNFNKRKLISIFSDINQIENKELLLNKIVGNNLTITLPISGKINEKEIQNTMKTILENVKSKHIDITTNASFQKRWIINSMKNFPIILGTPNVLLDIDKEFIKKKPVVLVAAGPSLSYDIEQLKYIKENGLAYIFSVGSAINALLENNIIPDAACTYDPTSRNQIVFEKIKEFKLSNIPMIFGSSVGFETLVDYPGPLVHMITSQDTISASLLDTSTQNIDIILDSPSIAIITFQLLTMLEVSKIILVGQNFGYLNNKRYAKGINYDFVKNELSEKEKEEIVTCEGVEDNEQVFTSKSFLTMKKNMEYFIANNTNIEVINTTQFGAKIEGTHFMLLKEVITSYLKERNLVKDNWYQASSSYDLTVISKNLQFIQNEAKKIPYYFEKNLEILRNIELVLDKGILNKLENLYGEFDQHFILLKENKFYLSILEPMIRVQNKKLSEEILEIKYEQNVRKKAKMILKSFGKLLEILQVNYDFAIPIFNEMVEEVKEKGVKIDE